MIKWLKFVVVLRSSCHKLPNHCIFIGKNAGIFFDWTEFVKKKIKNHDSNVRPCCDYDGDAAVWSSKKKTVQTT